jgi:hypothetical protein
MVMIIIYQLLLCLLTSRFKHAPFAKPAIRQATSQSHIKLEMGSIFFTEVTNEYDKYEKG